MIQYIFWNIDPAIFKLNNGFEIRWYGLLFASAFLIGQKILTYVFQKENVDLKNLDNLTIYAVIGTVLGARLGHCLFYEPSYYLSNPLEILMVWKGGLASHGAGVGLLTSLYLFYRKYRIKTYLWTLDRVALVVALAALLIRTGNLMNSEIIGKPTSEAYGFFFAKTPAQSVDYLLDKYNTTTELSRIEGDTTLGGVTYPAVLLTVNFDKKAGLTENQVKIIMEQNVINYLLGFKQDERHLKFAGEINANIKISQTGVVESASIKAFAIPRHPAQLYEAITSFLLFGFMILLYKKKEGILPDGLLFGVFSVYIFTLRFLYEFLKENQVAMEDNLPINMGQILSIPMVMLGIYLLIVAYQKRNTSMPE